MQKMGSYAAVSGRHWCLKRAFAHERDHRVKRLRRDSQQVLQRFDVCVVLPQRVLEFMRPLVELLRQCWLISLPPPE